jgi:hypothetical protein
MAVADISVVTRCVESLHAPALESLARFAEFSTPSVGSSILISFFGGLPGAARCALAPGYVLSAPAALAHGWRRSRAYLSAG